MATSAARWWSKDTVAVVTGSNQGIGFEIVKGLAKNGITTVLTARDEGRGQKALQSLKTEGLESVVFHPLDVTKAESIDNLATWLKKGFGGVDILVNNAGMYAKEVNYDGAKQTLDTNFYSAVTVTKKLLPLLRPGARIVNVSSLLGQLSYLGGESLRKKLGDEEHLNEEVVDSFASKYLEDVKAGRSQEEGWCTKYVQYADSKVLMNAYTRALAKTLSSRPDNQKISVNAINPGYVATGLNNYSADAKGADVGADTPVWLALLPEEDYPNGKFFSARKLISW